MDCKTQRLDSPHLWAVLCRSQCNHSVMQSMPLMWSAVTAAIVLNFQRLCHLLQSMPSLYFAVNASVWPGRPSVTGTTVRRRNGTALRSKSLRRRPNKRSGGVCGRASAPVLGAAPPNRRLSTRSRSTWPKKPSTAGDARGLLGIRVGEARHPGPGEGTWSDCKPSAACAGQRSSID